MSARPIGDILPGVLERCATMMRFQHMLAFCATPSGQKQMIMEARDCGEITHDETRLLIEIYGLESA